MKSKTDYRIYAKELRKSLDIHSLSKKAVNAVKCHPFYRQAKNIMF